MHRLSPEKQRQGEGDAASHGTGRRSGGSSAGGGGVVVIIIIIIIIIFFFFFVIIVVVVFLHSPFLFLVPEDEQEFVLRWLRADDSDVLAAREGRGAETNRER